MRSFLFTLLVLVSVSTFGQQYDNVFGPYLNNAPLDMHVRQHSDGNYILYGYFDKYAGKLTGPIIKVDTKGDPVAGFKPLLGERNVRNVHVFPSGKMLVNTGNPAYGGKLIMLNSDGSVDETFQNTSMLDVVTFVVQSTGKIVVIGMENGGYVLKRLNASGSLDNSFAATIAVSWTNKLEIDADDRIYTNSNVLSGGMYVGSIVTRLLPEGVTDNSFNFSIDILLVTGIKLQEGKVLLVLEGIEAQQYVSKIIRVSNAGLIDNTFTSAPFNGQINTICVRKNGKILVAGQDNQVKEFNSNGSLNANVANIDINVASDLYEDAAGRAFISGGFHAVNGNQNAYSIVRMKLTNEVDTDFKMQAFVTGDYQNMVALQSGKRLLIWGLREFYGMGTTNKFFLRLLPDGDVDPTFNPGIEIFNINGGAAITSLAVQADDRIVVSGYHLFPNGRPFGRLMADGAVDQTFNIGTGPNMTSGISGVNYVKQLGDKLYVAGDFDGWNGAPASAFVILDKNGAKIGPQINSLPDYSKNHIFDIQKQSDGKLILRGTFEFPNGTKEVIRLNLDGSVDNTFDMVLPSGSSGPIVVDVNDEIYLSGGNLDGVIGRTIIKFSKDGSRIPGEISGFAGSDYPIIGMHIVGEFIALSGQFTKYKDQTALGYLVIDKNGNRVDSGPTYDPGTTGMQSVATQNGVYFLGRFSEEGGKKLSSIKRFFFNALNNVTNFTAVNDGSDKINLTWQGTVTAADKLILERSANKESGFAKIAEPALNAQAYADVALQEATKYYYRLSGENAQSISVYSSTNATTAILSQDVLPATEIALNSFKANWTYRAGTDSVLLQVTKDNFVTLANGANGQYVKSGSALISNLTAGTTYKYRVRRYRNGIMSEFSPSQEVQLPVVITSTVTDFKIASFTSSSLGLSWSGGFAGAEKIMVERSTAANPNYTVIAELAVTANTYTNVDLLEATRYSYRIKGKSGVTITSPHDTDGFTLVAPITATAPTNITFNSFVANWNYPVGTDSVQLQVSKDGFTTFLAGFQTKYLKTASASITALAEGTPYQYRVKRFRNGRSSEFSAAITANVILGAESTTAITYYPNPVTDFLVIDPGQSRISVNIFSSSGASHYSATTDSKLSIDMRDYAAGMYFLGVTEGLTTRRYKVLKR
jgi:uncharacterized delta-60 repeat protein